jgi:hypothetical protein
MLLASVPAIAGPYIGGSVGQGDVDRSIASALITSGSFDGKDTAFKIFSGYMFTPSIGVESAYVNFGEATYAGEFSGLPVTGGTLKASGFTLELLASHSLTPEFSVFGKLGVLFWEWRANDTTAGEAFVAVEHGRDLMFGLGVTYSLGRRWGLRAEWERFKLDDASADLLSVGLVWSF